MRRWVPLIAALVVLAAPTGVAHAVVPEDAVAGPGKYWFTGTNIQQWGTNCSILGTAKPEPMVSSTASYGGVAGLPAVGEKYWISVLVSIPGTPCGTGIASVVTDLVLPPNTTVDMSRRIQCFGTRRFESDFMDITDQTFTWEGSTYDYCPDVAGISQYRNALNFGYRLLANGQMFEIFVPVTTSAPIGGADKAQWLIDGTGVYSDEQPGVTNVWTTVVPTSLGSTPAILFTRQAARPYWDKSAKEGARNRVEFFMTLYTAGQAGTLSFELVTEAGVVDSRSSDPGMNWDGTVPAGATNVLVLKPAPDNKGPNGGYVPWAFPDNAGRFKMRWIFTTATGTYTNETDVFRVLPGPDNDGDGVADAEDACPNEVGSAANGCPPTAQPDDDKDGVAGTADKCPKADGRGHPSGCPMPKGRTKAPKRMTRKQALAGVPVSFTCDVDAKVQLRLVVDKAGQAKLGIVPSEAPLTIATGTGKCKKGKKGGKATLKVARKYAKKLGASKGRATATLEIVMTGAGNAARTTTQKTTVT